MRGTIRASGAPNRPAKKKGPKKGFFTHVGVIGLGGIWSNLWKILCRTLSYTEGAPKKLFLIDKDQFTAGNLERQDMTFDDDARLKAKVSAERIAREFLALKVTPICEFVTKKNVRRFIKNRGLYISCVDNDATRKLLAEHVRELEDVVLITAANDEVRCSAHIHVVLGGKEITLGMDKIHDKVANPADKNPGDLSCEERARLPGGGQTATANMFAASFAQNYVWEVLRHGNRGPDDVLKNEGLLTKSETFMFIDKLRAAATSRMVGRMASKDDVVEKALLTDEELLNSVETEANIKN